MGRCDGQVKFLLIGRTVLVRYERLKKVHRRVSLALSPGVGFTAADEKEIWR